MSNTCLYAKIIRVLHLKYDWGVSRYISVLSLSITQLVPLAFSGVLTILIKRSIQSSSERPSEVTKNCRKAASPIETYQNLIF